MITSDLHNPAMTIALEKERPVDVTDGHDTVPRPDNLSYLMTAQEAGKRYADASVTVGHVALTSPENPTGTNG